MQTGTSRHPTDANKFVLRAVAGSLALFALIRLNWTVQHLVVPLTELQARGSVAMFGRPALPLFVTLECSGADILALCLGAVLAYPVQWRMRLAGALGAIVLLLGLNTLRIGTLGLVVTSPELFNTLHVYVWPAVLTLVAVGYVFGWMHLADRSPEHRAAGPLQPSRRFITLTAIFLVIFLAAAPLYLNSSSVLALAGVIAGTAALILSAVGVNAHAVANVLWMPVGGILVTQECISTPLVPLYLAAVCSYCATRRGRVFGILATVPLFAALGVVRLLVLALPSLATPFFFVHAFYQLLLGGVVVYLAARWQHGHRMAPAYAGAGIVAGVVFLLMLGPFYTQLMIARPFTPMADPQGAVTFLPAFQVALFLALGIAALTRTAWRPFVAGLTLLCVTQTIGLQVLSTFSGAAAEAIHVRDVRGWAIGGPVLIFATVVALARKAR